MKNLIVRLIDNFLPLTYRGLSILFRVGLILYIPKLLEQIEYNKYALFVSLISVVSTTSGIGYPVLFIKKYALGEFSKNFYIKYIIPISIVSGLIIFLISLLFIPLKLGFLEILFLIVILITEVVILEYLRLFQAKSDLNNHIKVSLIKSAIMFMILAALYLAYSKITITLILLSWIISSLITIVAIHPKLSEVMQEKKHEHLFSLSILGICITYFISYLADRYVLYYDKTVFFRSIETSSLVKLNIMFFLFQSAFSLIESTIFLKRYNSIFNSKFFPGRKEVLIVTGLFSLFSAIVATFLFKLYPQYFGSVTNFLHALIASFAYFIFSALSWFFNIKNYSNQSAGKFAVISLCGAIIYIILINNVIQLGFNVFFIPVLYPIAYFISHFSARFILHN